MTRVDTMVIDLDGTLLDSVYVQALAWKRAFSDVGLEVASYRLHGLIGMGGDRLVTAAAGQAVEEALGDELRSRQPQHLMSLLAWISPTEGAVELLETCRAHGIDVVLASSGDREVTDRLLELLDGGPGLFDRILTGSDADESKPSGEVVQRALDAVDAGAAVVVGDAVWDVKAAHEAGVPCIGLLTGGVTEVELRDAGATAVHASPKALTEHLAATGDLR